MSAVLNPQAGMRLSTFIVMLYDSINTVPTELRLYKRQQSLLRPSFPCLLFFLARYTGIIYASWIIYVSFAPGWTPEKCAQLIPAGSYLRSFASSISALVFLWRTWAIWEKNNNIIIVMGISLIPVTIFSWAPGILQRLEIENGGCTGVSSDMGPLSFKWTFALVNMVYDTIAFCLATYRLQIHVRGWNSPISKVLITDGIGYFVIAVAMHITNLIFLLDKDPKKQGTLMTFQTAVTSILSQRIITSPYERLRSLNSTDPEHTSDRRRSVSWRTPIFRRALPSSLSFPRRLSGMSSFSRNPSSLGNLSGKGTEFTSVSDVFQIEVAVQKQSRVEIEDESVHIERIMDGRESRMV